MEHQTDKRAADSSPADPLADAAGSALRPEGLLAADHETVTLTITDDGARWAARSTGNGLPGLRARAGRIGGTVATESAATGQARLIWRAPVRALPSDAPSR